MRSYNAEVNGRISPVDEIQSRYSGWRVASGLVAAATTTVTVLEQKVQNENGKRDNLTLALTDLVVYAQAAGATVTVQSQPNGGTAQNIVVFAVGAGTSVLPLQTAICADRGEDLVVTVAAAGTACSVLALGRVL